MQHLRKAVVVIAFVFAICRQCEGQGPNSRSGTMLYVDGKLEFVEGINENGVAWANLSVEYTDNGWNTLSVATTSSTAEVDENVARYGAGYLEGYFTQTLIHSYFLNEVQELLGSLDDPTYAKAFAYVEANNDWVIEQIQANSNDPYWQEVQLIWIQLQGILDGYNTAAPPDQKMKFFDLLIINLDGDLFDIMPAFAPNATKQNPDTHCSALIRFTQADLFCGHTTWDSFQTMTRIFKRYNFPTTNSEVKATETYFPGYPGALSSLDDFYIMNNNLFVAETSIQNYNMSLYSRLTPSSISSWARTVVANRMAYSSPSWCEIYAKYNSGTYNNQWMVVDHSLFTPGMSELAPNTVWILEQIPGDYRSGDVTDVVNKQGYWSSYNVPYFDYVYDIMEFPEAAAEDPENGRNCSRHNIFAREAVKVETLADMQHVMQFNEWQTDPFSSHDPCNSIAARCDLGDPSDAEAFGGLDSKVTNHAMMKSMTSMAISGPTHQTQTPFEWDSSPNWKYLNHFGQPNEFNFDWVLMEI